MQMKMEKKIFRGWGEERTKTEQEIKSTFGKKGSGERGGRRSEE